MFSRTPSLISWTALFCCLCVHSCLGQYNDSQCTNSSATGSNYSMCLDENPYESCPDPSLCDIVNSGDNVGLAFGLTIGAGLATTVGALLPFVPCIKRSNTLYLAAGLALAAGVMLYVSFTEIWTKSKWNFCCESTLHYDLLTAACFFAGILITVGLDILVTLLQKIDCGCMFPCLVGCCKRRGDHSQKSHYRVSASNVLRQSVNRSHHDHKHDSNGLILPDYSSQGSGVSTPTADSLQEGSEVDVEISSLPPADSNHDNQIVTTNGTNDDAVSHGPSIGTCTSVLPSNSDGRCNVITPDGVSESVMSNAPSESTNNYGNASVNELFSNSSLLRMNAVIPERVESEGDSAIDLDHTSQAASHMTEGGDKSSGLIRRNSYLEMVDQVHDSFEPQGPKEFKEVTEGLGKDAKKLHRMGILTGLAIAIHNFPEGLATFVATLSSPSLGIALCIAIAFHNIPEGVCVAMPVYYATGSRWKAFLWAFLSGISEPIGALLGWLVLKDVFGPLVYGIAFGLISGMMVFISLKELLPTARKFDKTKGVLVNTFIIIGMVVMALSLILFLY